VDGRLNREIFKGCGLYTIGLTLYKFELFFVSIAI